MEATEWNIAESSGENHQNECLKKIMKIYEN